MWAELSACLQKAQATDGLDMTIVFSLKRDGSLLGKPRIAHANATGSPDLRRAAGSVAQTMARCLPLSITTSLGGAIAGQQLKVRILGKHNDTDS
jgi:hypothetical protein